MASRTRSSSSYRKGHKAQFFVLSAFVIITILFVVSQFVQPAAIFDSSSAVLVSEPFTFNNIRDKSEYIVKSAETCGDMTNGLNEFKAFVENFGTKRNTRITYNFNVVSCVDSPRSGSVSFYLGVVSTAAGIDGRFTVTR